ncbi:MAG: hypothetical protein AAF078_11050, partial [Planctomycetota bacterium]
MTRNAPRNTRRLATLATALALTATFLASPATAQDGPRDRASAEPRERVRETREPRQERPRFLDRERVEALRKARG